MSSNLDKTIARSFTVENPFAYGEQTVLQMRSQPFEVQDELGTVVTMPIDTAPRTVLAEEDSLSRLERKLDTALQHIEKLQQRIQSLDLTLARALSR